MEEYVCKCINCNSYLYDENPQTNAIKHNVRALASPVLPMELLNDDGEAFLGCGNCQTDAYLIDLELQSQY